MLLSMCLSVLLCGSLCNQDLRTGTELHREARVTQRGQSFTEDYTIDMLYTGLEF
jgi:hypothetical protein